MIAQPPLVRNEPPDDSSQADRNLLLRSAPASRSDPAAEPIRSVDLPAAPSSSPDLNPALAGYLAALLRPSAKDRAITPVGYLAIVDNLDRARGAAPEGGHTGA